MSRLAKNIYGSDARFVFELLQNADDNRYTRARARGMDPAVSFQVHQDHIIVESNEDGFTEEDLTAICSVGKSTKSASYGYIGAKGIGFKSVFIAAWKVYIQSGDFSFFFKHAKGDLGLGMVQPIWMDPAEELEGPLTRMVLYLHEAGDAQEIEHLRKTVFKQLSDLQQTCLLFLRNIRRISITFYSATGDVATSKEYGVSVEGGHRFAVIADSRNGPSTESHERQLYHVTRHTTSDLPNSDNRVVNGSKHGSTASEVVLAFPLTTELRPSVSRQELFAFLPIRESDFKVSSTTLSLQISVKKSFANFRCHCSLSYKPTLTRAPIARTLSLHRNAT